MATSAAGTPFGPIGTITGGVGGAIISAQLNKKLKPIMEELALNLVGLDKEDIFYFKNKTTIDCLAKSYLGNVNILYA